MQVLFKGVRGTRPVPGKQTLKYGGNTSCVAVGADSQLLFLDAGTGLVEFRKSDLDLLGVAKEQNEYHIFLSHLHYDHIQGIPQFAPFFDSEAIITMYGERKQALGQELGFEDALRGQMLPPYYPIEMQYFPADLRFREVAPGEYIEIGTVRVDVLDLLHPNGCVSYRIEEKGNVLVYATDTSPLRGEKMDVFAEFTKGADLLIFDAFFDEEELYGNRDGINKADWGHSSWEYACDLAKSLEVRRLALYHHKDTRTDEELDIIERKAKARYEGAFCAKEGDLIEIRGEH